MSSRRAEMQGTYARFGQEGTPTPGFAAGSRVSHYKILGRVATGGMGVVFRARDTRLGRDVAIKTLAEFLARDAEAIHRFQLEARAVSALAHPNVLTIYDVGSYKGTPYQVSEFLEGETLRGRLDRGRLRPEEALELAAQFASGLAAAHEAGIVHRDLKPENVFITTDGRVKILDFGLAKLLPQARIVPERLMGKAGVPDMKTQQGAILGTVAYMAPEQVQGAPADRRSDVFAFGSILHEMLSGEQAFAGGDMRATGIAILMKEPAPLRDAPPELDAIVRRCLKKRPEERFESGHELLRALKELHPSIDHAPAVPEPPGAGPIASVAPLEAGTTLARAAAASLRRSLPLRWIGVGAIALAAAVVGALIWRTVHRPPSPPASLPTQITFQRGAIWSARFLPDGRVMYSAAWEGKPDQTQTVVPGKPAFQPTPVPPARLLSVSHSGELAISIDVETRSLDYMRAGTLARVSLNGEAPRQLLTDVLGADWDAAGKQLVVVRTVDGKSRVEYPPGRVLYSSDGWLSNPRISPRGQIAFIEHPFFGDTRGVVMMIDAARKVAPLTADLGSAMGIAWSTGGEVWFTGGETAQSAALRAVTPDGKQRVIRQEAGALVLHDIAPDGRVLIARESWHHLIRGMPPGASQERNLSFQDYSVARDLSADGRKLLFFEAGQAGGELFGAYLSAMDGSAPVQLGAGYALSISADGKWALLGSVRAPSELMIVPTGPGESRKLALPVVRIAEARWFPDAKSILVTALERSGGQLRVFVVDAATARLRALSEAGVPGQEMLSMPISPDGRQVLVVRRDGWFVYPVSGGEPRRVEGLKAGQVPVGWHPDGASLLVREPGLPMQVSRLDLVSLTQRPWRALAPPDAAGVSDIPWVYVPSSYAGDAYVYTYPQIVSDLYVYRGLQ